MARSNLSIVQGFDADPAEMRAMEAIEDRMAWMDQHLIVKSRSGKWSEPSMKAIGEKAGIRFEMQISVK